VLNEKKEFMGAAFRAAMLAGDFVCRNLGTISKDDADIQEASDFVTHVDRASEQIIIKTIKRKLHHHHILAEESLREPDAGHYRWIIDPLDGTTNYIHGYPVFSLSIALQFNDEIILGIVFDPMRNEVFSAEKGKGAFLNGKSIRVSSVGDMANSLVATGFPFRKKNLIDAYLTLFKNIFNRVSDIRRAGSAALDLAHVAAGRCDGFFEIALGPWDIAAGSLLVSEAGGAVTDFGGGHDYISTGNIVAASPSIHREMLREVRGAFAGIIEN